MSWKISVLLMLVVLFIAGQSVCAQNAAFVSNDKPDGFVAVGGGGTSAILTTSGSVLYYSVSSSSPSWSSFTLPSKDSGGQVFSVEGNGYLSWDQAKSEWVNCAPVSKRTHFEGRYLITEDLEDETVETKDTLTNNFVLYKKKTDEVRAYIDGDVYLYKWDKDLLDFVYLGKLAGILASQ